MARRYASRAVEELRAFIETNFPAKLATINGEEGTTLAEPSVYRGAIHPFSTEPVSLEVESEAMRPEDLRNDYWFVDAVVHLILRGADAAIVTTQENLRRYVSALIRTIEADPSLGDKVTDAEIGETTFSGASQEGQLQGVASMRVTVKVWEP